MKPLLVVMTILLCMSAPAHASPASAAIPCHGRFINPLTDINWINMFPISIAGIPIGKSSPLLPDTIRDHVGSPVCACPIPAFPYVRVGLPIGFWEPVRLSEVVRKPLCFPSLGGVQIPLSGISMLFPMGTNGYKGSNVPFTEMKNSFYQIHWIANPMLFILNIITDVACLQRESFDVVYLTEFDPTWNDSEVAGILNPEALLFMNPIAAAACAVDCVASSAYLPLDPLFWCAGCQGVNYPFTGQITGEHVGGVQASLKLTERFQFKMHREGLAVISSIREGQCFVYPFPIVLKSQYRYQLVLPIKQTILPSLPFGRSTLITAPFKEFPVFGEDFVWQSWRKRDCCAL